MKAWKITNSTSTEFYYTRNKDKVKELTSYIEFMKKPNLGKNYKLTSCINIKKVNISHADYVLFGDGK